MRTQEKATRLFILPVALATLGACSALDAIGPRNHFECTLRAPDTVVVGQSATVHAYVSDSVCVRSAR